MPKRRFLESCLPIASLFVGLVLFYFPFLASDNVFFYNDATFFLKPQAQRLHEALATGVFPLWNTLNYCGMTQIAVTFPTLFYWADWLLVLLPFSVGLALNMIFHQILCAAGIYVLLRSFAYSALAASQAALVFALSGYSFGLISNHSLIAGLAWFVASLAAFRFLELSQGPTYYWKMLLAALTVCFLLLSGRPEIIAPSSILLVLFSIWRALERRRDSSHVVFDTTSQYQLRALFLGACFAMPQLLPVAEWLAVSRRASGLQMNEIFLYSANWYDILSVVIGPALGDLRLHAAQFRPLVDFANLAPYISCAYLGPFAITIALWGASDSRWKYRWIVVLGLMFSVLLSVGNNTFFLPALIKILPAIGVVRFPIKWFFLVVFCIAILAARGITTLSEGRAKSRVSALLWTAFAALSVALLLASEHAIQVLPFIQTSLSPDVYLKAERLIALSGLTTSFVGFAISIAALIMRKLDPNDKALPISLVLLTGASLMYSAFAFERQGAPNDFWSQASYAADQIHALEKQDRLPENSRVLNICLERVTVPPSYSTGGPNAATQLKYQYDRQILEPDSNIEFKIPETLGFEGTTSGDYFYTGLHSYLQSNQSPRPETPNPTDIPLSRFCALTSTQYVITQKYRIIGERIEVPLLDDQLFELRNESEPINVRIYKVKKTLPHCYLADVCRLAKNHNQVLESIVRPGLGDFDPLQSTFIEGGQAITNDQTPVPSQEKAEISAAEDAPTSIRIEQAEHVRIETNSKYPTTLVLTDQSYAGWVAALDGAKVPIEIANGFMRAVEIPTGGKHTVDFSYQPESLKLGLIIFGLGVFLSLYLGFNEYLKKEELTE